MKTKCLRINFDDEHYGVRQTLKAGILTVLCLTSCLFIGSPLDAQTNQNPVQIVCIGNEPYMVTATAGSAYTWSVSPGTSGINWLINGTGNSVTVDWNVPGEYTLSVTETNSSGCTGEAVSVSVTVLPTPDITLLSDLAVSNGALVNPISFSGTVSGTTFTWTNDTPSIGLGAGGSGDIGSFTATNSGNTPVVATITVTPTYTYSGTVCTGTPRTFTITVNPSTTIDPVSSVAYCSGTLASQIVFSSSVPGTTFSWINNNTVTGLGAAGTGNIPPFTAVNTGTAPVVSTITVTPYLNGQPGNPVSFTITVNPLPSTSPIFHN